MPRVLLLPRCLLVALGASGLLAAASADSPGDKKKIDIPALIDMHNKAREAEKLGPLKADPKLEAAAKVQAKDQADRGKMDHIGGDGSTPAERIAAQGYRYKTAGENVAMGQTSSRQVFEGWMNSPHHKDNILGNFTEIGAACYVSEDGIPYWCVTFGTPWPEVKPEEASTAMLLAVNEAREREKLDPVKTDEILKAAAMRHATEQSEAGQFLPADSDGQTPTKRAQKAGYRAGSIAQSDAMGQTDPAKAVTSWLESEDSKKVLLGDYEHIGIGIATDKKGIPYWTLLLGKPRLSPGFK